MKRKLDGTNVDTIQSESVWGLGWGSEWYRENRQKRAWREWQVQSLFNQRFSIIFFCIQNWIERVIEIW